MSLSVVTAFLAGAVSFISPCLLPLFPGYIALLLDDAPGGETVAAASQRQVLWRSLLFTVGFASVFIALGASAGVIGSALVANRDVLTKVAGLVIVSMGLVSLGVLKVPLLLREFRYQGPIRRSGVGAILAGLAFAFGWAPCAGPLLVAVLSLASAEETVYRGTLLLAAYSAGMAAPFLATAAGIRTIAPRLRGLGPRLVMIQRAAGGVLVATGVLVFLDIMGELAAKLTFLNRFVL